jgi:acetyltransferase-like isoleucine patch superfamily enzyme
VFEGFIMATKIEPSNFLQVGKDSFFNGDWRVTPLESAPISIGSFCAFGRNLSIITVNHDTRFAAVQGSLYRKYFNDLHPGEVGIPSRQRTKGGVCIGSDVWIGNPPIFNRGGK